MLACTFCTRANLQWTDQLLWIFNHMKFLDKNGNGEMILDTNQPVFCYAPTTFTKSVHVWNKGFNWPVCAKFRCPNSIEFSWWFYNFHCEWCQSMSNVGFKYFSMTQIQNVNHTIRKYIASKFFIFSCGLHSNPENEESFCS